MKSSSEEEKKLFMNKSNIKVKIDMNLYKNVLKYFIEIDTYKECKKFL